MLWSPCGICQIPKYVNWMRAYLCVRISVIKRTSSGPPCCFCVAHLVLLIHDNFGDEDGILRIFTAEKVKDILNKIQKTSQGAK